MGLLTKKFEAFSLEFVGEEIHSLINPDLAKDMDTLCDVIIYLEHTLHSMNKIVEINNATEKLAQSRKEIEEADWWKERRTTVDNATTPEQIWPFIKQDS